MLKRLIKSFGLQRSAATLVGKIVSNRERLAGERGSFTFDNLVIEVVRRGRGRIVLSVLPPNGNVRLQVPRNLAEIKLTQVVAKRREWIERARARMLVAGARYKKVFGVAPGSSQDLACGANVRLHSKNLKLQIVRVALCKRPSITKDVSVVAGGKMITLDSIPAHLAPSLSPALLMRVPSQFSAQQCERLLWSWYRRELERSVADLIAVWEHRLGVSVASWRVRRMYTRWGSCNTRAHNINLNIELVRRPRRCLEFVVVHELVHLLERGHTARFYALMDQFLPRWRVAKAVLDAVPLVRVQQNSRS